MAKAMKADGWGESTCREACRIFKLKSPYQVFLLKDILAILYLLSERKWIQYATLISVGKVMGSGKVSWDTIYRNYSFKIFDGYENLEEAYKDIEDYQVLS